MLCTQCGNDNPSGNRFCGSCGAKLEAAPPVNSTHEERFESEPKSRPVARSADLRDPTDPGRIVVPANGRNATHVPADEPVSISEPPVAHEVGPTLDAPLAYDGHEQVSAVPERSATEVASTTPRRDLSIHGPSLLGLNEDDDRPLTSDGSTTDYSYLYEDEGGTGRTVNWRLMLALVVLVGFAGVLAYMWAQGKSWNTLIVKNTATTQQPKDAPVVAKQEPTTPGAPEIDIGQTQKPVPASTPQSDGTAESNGTNAANNSKPAGAAANGTSTNSPAQQNAAATPATPPAATANTANKAGTSEQASNASADQPTKDDKAADTNNEDNAKQAKASASDNADDEEDAEPPAPAKNKTAALAATKGKGKASATKTARPDTSSEDIAQVHRADALLKSHHCNEAVDLLREAALHGNATARSRLGGLYATGTCVPLDRAEAYNWFTLAKDAGAHYSWIDHNRNMLWAEMTDRERERVMRR